MKSPHKTLSSLSIECFFACLVSFYINVVHAGEEPFVQDEILVRYTPSATNSDIIKIEAENNLTLVNEIKHLRIRHYKLPEGIDVFDAMGNINANPAVEFAEPNYYHRPQAFPSDPDFSKQWYLHNTGQVVNARDGPVDIDIDWSEAMDFYTGVNDVIVAVIDSGVALDHPELFDNRWVNTNEIPFNGIDDDGNGYIDDRYGWDFYDNDTLPFDENGHGTLVASLIGSVANNFEGIAGVATNVKIMPLRAFGDFGGGTGTSATFLTSTTYAANMGAKVINYSAGGSQYNFFEQLQIDYLNSQGVLLIAAAGNGGNDRFGDDNDQSPTYPTSYIGENIISVSATDRHDALTLFSNFGATTVDIAAPGEDIYGAGISRTTTYLENFETGGNGWTQGHLPSSQSFDNWSLYQDINGNTWITDSVDIFGLPKLYGPNTSSWAMSPPITLGVGAQLSFDAWHSLEANYDYLLLEISTDQINWDFISYLTGSSPFGFRSVSIDISAYDLQNVYIRFLLLSDESIQFDGVYLDNIAVSQVDVFQYDGTQYQYNNGTSFSAPLVSGAVALIMSQRPDLNHLQVRSLILDNVDQLPSLNGRVASGGRLNVNNAIQAAINFAPGELQFDSDNYVVDEDAGTVTVTVKRINGSDGEISVDYTTNDGSAIAGDDYTSSTGTLVFTDQEVSKSFNIAIVDDPDLENSETINLTLSNPFGAIIGVQSTSTITLLDNEQSPDISIIDPITPVNDLQVSFGDHSLLTTTTLDITVFNSGTSGLIINNIGSPSNFLELPFSLNQTCTANTIPPAGNCTITVQFAPVNEGIFNDSFNILSNDPDESSVIINVSGAGLTSPPPQTPAPANHPPSTPDLVSPVIGETGLSTSVTFQWNSATDPDGDAISYEITYCDSPSFTGCASIIIASIADRGVYYAGLGTSGTLLLGFIGSILGSNRRRIKTRTLIIVSIACSLLAACGGGGSGSSNAGNNSAPITSDVSYTASGLLANTTYYWKVIAKDDRGGRTESGVRSFTTQ